MHAEVPPHQEHDARGEEEGGQEGSLLRWKGCTWL